MGSVSPMTTSSSRPDSYRFTAVIPARQERDSVTGVLERLAEAAQDRRWEAVLVVDDRDDSTIEPFLHTSVSLGMPARVVINRFGNGPAGALRTGFEEATAPVVLVTMGDGCDDAGDAIRLVEMIEAGASVAVASRNLPGGGRHGAPRFKRLANGGGSWLLRRLTGFPCSDPSNAFKAYDASFLRSVAIEASAGFAVSIELVAKAHRNGLAITEIPTFWQERTAGSSSFRFLRWAPEYLRWFRYALAGTRTRRALMRTATPTPQPLHASGRGHHVI